MGPQSSVDAYVICELGRKNMGEHLMPHHGIEPSSPKLAGLLQALNNVGCVRNNFAHFKGRLPSRVECRRYLRDVAHLLASPCFARDPSAAPLDQLISGQPRQVSVGTAIKYLLRHLLIVLQCAGNDFIAAMDLKGTVIQELLFKYIYLLDASKCKGAF